MTAKVGEPVVLKFPMNKAGYVFAGWYLDEAYTQWYDVSIPKNDHEDITLYAKWVESDSAAKLNVKGATLVNANVNAFAYGVIGETFREPTIVLNAGETVLWFADADFTTPFDFTKAIENTDEVTIYAAILKEGQTLEDLKNESGTNETTSPTESSSQSETTPSENSDDNKVEITTIVLVAFVIIAIAAAIFSMALVLKKKSA